MDNHGILITSDRQSIGDDYYNNDTCPTITSITSVIVFARTPQCPSRILDGLFVNYGNILLSNNTDSYIV